MKHYSDFATEIRFIERIYRALKQGGAEDNSMHSGICAFSDKVVSSIEALLLKEDRTKPWVIYALAEIAIGSDNELPGSPTPAHLLMLHLDGMDRLDFLDYLFDAAEVGYVPAQLELVSLAEREQLLLRGFANLPKYEKSFWLNEQHAAFDADQRLIWLREAAKNESDEAQHWLGCELARSTDSKEKAEGIDWLWRARRGGNSDAAYDLAMQLRAEATALVRHKESVFSLFEFAANAGKYEAMLEVGSALEHGADVERDLRVALDWYEKAAALDDDEWAESSGDANYRAGILRQQLATSDEDRAWANRYFRKAAKLGHMKASLEAAKLMIQSRDGYEYSQYKYRGQWERENEEYDAQFAEGVALLEKVAGQSNSDAEDRIKALSILAEIYEDERIRCHSQFEPIGDRERLECALEYYRTLSQLDVNADDQARNYYRDSIVRIQSMLNALPENTEDPE